MKAETKKGSGPFRKGFIACLVLLALLLLLSPWMSKIDLLGSLHQQAPRDIRLSPAAAAKVECVSTPATSLSQPAAQASPVAAAASPSASPAASSNLFASLWQLNDLQGRISHTDIGAWPVQATESIRSHVGQGQGSSDKVGPSMQPATCDDIFGLTFLHSWKRAELCQPLAEGTADSLTSSSISARYVTMGPGNPKPSRFIVMESFNVLLDSGAFSAKFDGEGNPQPAAGSIKAACTRMEAHEAWREYSELRAVSQVLRQALQDKAGPEVQQACAAGSANIVDHPVLLLQRYDTTNIYHFLEDVVTVFTALSVLNSSAVKEKGLEVVIADSKALGFYMEVWQRLSFPYPLRILKDNPFPPGSCFRHIIYTQFAPPSLFSLTWQLPALVKPMAGRECMAAVYIGMSNWLRALFPEITALSRTLAVPLQSQQGGDAIVTKTVVWVSRRNYELIHSAAFSEWQSRRIYPNENQLLLALNKAVLDWNDRACFRVQAPRGPKVEGCRNSRVVFKLEVIEPSDVPFYPRQLQSFSQMSILMGGHGAGMANAMWMVPFSGGVVEVQHNVGGQPHYSHLSQALGQKYTVVNSGGNDINVDQAVAALTRMMDDVA